MTCNAGGFRKYLIDWLFTSGQYSTCRGTIIFRGFGYAISLQGINFS